MNAKEFKDGLTRARAELVALGYCAPSKDGAGDPEVKAIDRALAADQMVRNIIYNVQQNPAHYTVEELLRNMRQAIGVKADERV